MLASSIRGGSPRPSGAWVRAEGDSAKIRAAPAADQAPRGRRRPMNRTSGARLPSIALIERTAKSDHPNTRHQRHSTTSNTGGEFSPALQVRKESSIRRYGKDFCSYAYQGRPAPTCVMEETENSSSDHKPCVASS